MLLCQDFRRCHKGALFSVPGSAVCCCGGHHGLAAAHITLNQPVHRCPLPEVPEDFLHSPLLGTGKGKGQTLIKQLTAENKLDRLELPFHKSLMNDELPLTIGGGIGQSRLCMQILQKAHIGEVHASVWPEEEIQKCKELGIELL